MEKPCRREGPPHPSQKQVWALPALVFVCPVGRAIQEQLLSHPAKPPLAAARSTPSAPCAAETPSRAAAPTRHSFTFPLVRPHRSTEKEPPGLQNTVLLILNRCSHVPLPHKHQAPQHTVPIVSESQREAQREAGSWRRTLLPSSPAPLLMHQRLESSCPPLRQLTGCSLHHLPKPAPCPASTPVPGQAVLPHRAEPAEGAHAAGWRGNPGAV